MAQSVAIITGAGRGIGRATAIELARAGYALVLAARNGDELRETLRLAAGSASSQHLVRSTDVTQSAEVEQLVAAAVERFGRLDAIVHSAGIAPVRSIAEMTVAEWHATLDTNLSAAFYLCRAAWPTFAKQRSGVVVNVSSLSARDPFAGFAAYGAAKAGVNLFGLSAAREGEAIGVRVHTVAPGAVETSLLRQVVSAEQFPTDKTLEPADVARVIVGCVRGDLRHTSGEVIYVHRTAP